MDSLIYIIKINGIIIIILVVIFDYYHFKCFWKMLKIMICCMSAFMMTFGIPNWDARFVGKPWKATKWIWKKAQKELNLFPGLAKCILSYLLCHPSSAHSSWRAAVSLVLTSCSCQLQGNPEHAHKPRCFINFGHQPLWHILLYL